MARRMPNRLADIRKKRKLSQQQLADLVESHSVTISKLERGVMQMTGPWLERLAEALQVDAADILSSQVQRRDVEISGEIREDGTFASIDADGAVFMSQVMPENDDAVSWWAQIVDDAMHPFLRDGDLVRFVNVDKDEVEHYFGRICYIEEFKGLGFVGFLGRAGVSPSYEILPIRGPRRIFRNITTIALAAEFRLRMPWQLETEPLSIS